MNAPTKLPAKYRNRINKQLDLLCKTYHPAIPTTEIQSIFSEFELKLEDGIYCGADGECMEEIGNGCWLRMTWHKMPSGRYEIVAYVS